MLPCLKEQQRRAQVLLARCTVTAHTTCQCPSPENLPFSLFRSIHMISSPLRVEMEYHARSQLAQSLAHSPRMPQEHQVLYRSNLYGTRIPTTAPSRPACMCKWDSACSCDGIWERQASHDGHRRYSSCIPIRLRIWAQQAGGPALAVRQLPNHLHPPM